MWESRADLEDQRGWYPSPRQPLPLYMINNGGTGNGPHGVTEDITPEAHELLESLLQHLLPTPVVLPPKATPIPSELELLIQRLMGNDPPVQPAPMGRSSFTDMEVLLQNFPPVGPNAGTGRLWCVSRAASRVMRPRGVPLWMKRFLSCRRDGRWKGWETVLLCGHPG